MKTTTEIIEENKKAIVLLGLIMEKENKTGLRGTGFIVSEDGNFITNAHVYKSISSDLLQYLKIKVLDSVDDNGIERFRNYEVELIELDEENDIALMKIVSSDKKFHTIANFGDSEMVKEGADVVFVGFPLGTELLKMGMGISRIANKCLIGAIKKRGSDGSLHFFLIDTHINNGSSGSPVFSDNGELIGVASGKISNRIKAPNGDLIDVPANLGICRPSNYIQKIINKNSKI